MWSMCEKWLTLIKSQKWSEGWGVWVGDKRPGESTYHPLVDSEPPQPEYGMIRITSQYTIFDKRNKPINGKVPIAGHSLGSTHRVKTYITWGAKIFRGRVLDRAKENYSSRYMGTGGESIIMKYDSSQHVIDCHKNIENEKSSLWEAFYWEWQTMKTMENSEKQFVIWYKQNRWMGGEGMSPRQRERVGRESKEVCLIPSVGCPSSIQDNIVMSFRWCHTEYAHCCFFLQIQMLLIF